MIVTSNAGSVVVILTENEAASFDVVISGFINAVDANAGSDYTLDCTVESEAYRLAKQYKKAMVYVYEDKLIGLDD